MSKSEKLLAIKELFDANLIELKLDDYFKLLEIPMSFAFEIDDDVKITDSWNPHYGEIATIHHRRTTLLGYNEYDVKIQGSKYWGGYTIETFEEAQLKIWTSAQMKSQLKPGVLSAISNTISPSDYEWVVKTPMKSILSGKCYHDWKETKLIFTSVYDCKKCGRKKEEVDKENSESLLEKSIAKFNDDDCPF